MSTQLFNHNGLAVTRYAGPELPFDGNRVRYQITDTITGQLITINYAQWDALTQFITANCGAECESPRTEPIPENWRWNT